VRFVADLGQVVGLPVVVAGVGVVQPLCYLAGLHIVVAEAAVADLVDPAVQAAVAVLARTPQIWL